MTGGTVAVTWDPANKGPDLVLSNGNLTITHSAASADWEQVIATLGKSTGKWYFEVAITNGSSVVTIGVQDGTESFETYTGDTFDGWGYMANGRFYNSGIIYPLTATYTDGDVIGVAVDMDAGKIWWSKNGIWKGITGTSPDPATGTDPGYANLAGTLYPAATIYLIDDEIIGRFTSASQTYSAPSGFSAWGD